MKSRKVKITIWYLFTDLPMPMLKNESTATTVIIDECYLLEFLPSLVRPDIQKVEVCEYNE